MPHIEINQEKAASCIAEILSICPFKALEEENGKVVINAACKMCKVCTKRKPDIFKFIDDSAPGVDKSLWRGITVVGEITAGKIHPVTLELLGKAKELAAKINHPVYCVLIGSGIRHLADQLLEYGPDEVFVYDMPELHYFRIEPYTAVLEDFINRIKPCAMLVGGTNTGRSLAPRTAARFRTGLTADCTVLDMSESTDLDQIRPAYGGNIMAHINTPRHRPQFATVRYKIFSIPPKCAPHGKITDCTVAPEKLVSGIEILSEILKPEESSIEDAEVIIAVGRGLKKADDMAMIEKLASLLNAKVASSRPLVEGGWTNARQQIGLSGRTVKPKLIIACGISGAIQFVAGMKSSDLIVAINTDPEAPIFKVAHIAIVGDLYKVIPGLIQKIEAAAGA